MVFDVKALSNSFLDFVVSFLDSDLSFNAARVYFFTKALDSESEYSVNDMLLAPFSSLISLQFFSSREVSFPERAAATSDIDAFSSDDAVLVD